MVVIIIVAIVGIYTINSYEPAEPTSMEPSIVFATPTGTSIPTEAPITIRFDRKMNKDSVESAFSISPIKLGSFSWDERTNFDGKSVQFIPMNNLRTGTQYTVTINIEAVDVDGYNLTTGIYQFNFTTEGETTTCRNVGSGTDDFWIQYPLNHPSSNQSVEHPDWVKDAVVNKVVMILSHSDNCSPCIKQIAICEDINESSVYIEYFDLITSFNDPESTWVFSNYSPEGYWIIPLTIVLTKVTDSNGNDCIGWHSWVGVVDKAMLTSWLEDAITYHNDN